MSEKTVAWLMMGVGTLQVLLLVGALATLNDEGLSKPAARPRRSDKLFGILGVLMTALDDALARFTAFAKGVLDQLKGAKADNDAQTAALAELQAKLDTALADDAADKAAIDALREEVTTLQDKVAAQINAAVDALENPPAADVPVAEDTPAVVDETGSTPVE